MNPAQIKQLIKKTAKQFSDEPLEILKSASKQIAPEESLAKPTEKQSNSNQDSNKQEEQYKEKVASQDTRQLQALEAELRDIRRQKLFNELMQRVQTGEDVPLVEFSELSYEQKDVLKAQIEAAKKRREAQFNQVGGIPEPAAKRGRKMGGGQKGAAKKEQTRVEKPVPPSG